MEKGFLVVSVTVLLLVSCAGGNKLQVVKENGVTAAVAVVALMMLQRRSLQIQLLLPAR
ncbi:MAG: hypothetical protein IKK19_01710 [Bacteroidales bacterium]|nr:hypothetical protein [Bacteroidales bacterium]